MDDGRVEVIAEGPRGKIHEFISWCHQGPTAASVLGVDIVWEQATSEFTDFHVRY
jgi:acylphosphatase